MYHVIIRHLLAYPPPSPSSDDVIYEQPLKDNTCSHFWVMIPGDGEDDELNCVSLSGCRRWGWGLIGNWLIADGTAGKEWLMGNWAVAALRRRCDLAPNWFLPLSLCRPSPQGLSEGRHQRQKFLKVGRFLIQIFDVAPSILISLTGRGWFHHTGAPETQSIIKN